MSLSEAMRKLGNIESLRGYAKDSPGVTGFYANEVLGELGEALEQTIQSQFSYQSQDIDIKIQQLKSDIIKIIKEAVKEGIKEGVKEGINEINNIRKR